MNHSPAYAGPSQPIAAWLPACCAVLFAASLALAHELT